MHSGAALHEEVLQCSLSVNIRPKQHAYEDTTEKQNTVC